jgi:hypothetical protein
MKKKILWQAIGLGVVSALLLIVPAIVCTGAGDGIFFPIFFSSGPFCILAPFSEIGAVISFICPLLLWPVLFWLALSAKEKIMKIIFLPTLFASGIISGSVSYFYDIGQNYFETRYKIYGNSMASNLWIAFYCLINVILIIIWWKKSKFNK